MRKTIKQHLLESFFRKSFIEMKDKSKVWQDLKLTGMSMLFVIFIFTVILYAMVLSDYIPSSP